MTHDDLIRNLVQTVLDTGSSPEEVCAEYPDLVSEVRTRWKLVQEVGARMDILFPQQDDTAHVIENSASTMSQGKFPAIPGYEIESLLGRGGMGIVYRARHLKLNRRVAVKMLLAGTYADPVELARFQKEAEVVASLHHPHIVQIYDLGDFEGSPYFTMELMEGGTLAQKIGGMPQPVMPCAEMLMILAGAVDAAHACGIIHRDLKPGNILLTVDGIPKISDFGLARRFDDEHLTVSGNQVGTPSYMAPEQASGRPELIDSRTDVYALGAILYEMFTGRPPFFGRTPLETLSRTLLFEPVRPSHLVSNIPRDAETICLKCLEKSPEKRYASAADLAADLKRFTRNEPIRARPISTTERTVRWMARYKGLSAALMSVALLLVLLAVGSTIAAAYFRRSEQQQTALAAEKGQLLVKEAKARELATSAEKVQASLRLNAERNLYFAQMILGGQAAQSSGGIGRVLELVTPWQNGRPDFRDWEWYYLNSLCHRDVMTLRGHTQFISSVVWSPDGSKFASAGGDATVAIWNAAEGRQIFRCGGHPTAVTALAWSPDSRKVASAGVDNTARIWDATTGGPVSITSLPAMELSSIAWSPDGTQLALGDKFRDILLLNVSDSTSIQLPHEHQTGVLSVAWSPRGGQLASGGKDSTVRIWDASARKQITVLRGHTGAVTAVAWSPDGSSVASASDDHTVKIWDAKSGAERSTFAGHAQAVSSVAWSADGTRLATSSYDQAVKVWNVATGKEIESLRGHASRVTSVAWNPDGTRIASSSVDGTVKVWDPDIGAESITLNGKESPIYSLNWNDNEHLSSTYDGGTVKLFNIIQHQEQVIVRKNLTGARYTVCSPDGRWSAYSGADGIIHVWDVAKNQELKELRGHTGTVLSLSPSPEGRRLASGGSDRTVRIWDPMAGTLLHTCTGNTSQITALAWAREGRWLASGAENGAVKVFNSDDGNAAFAYDVHAAEVTAIAWSADDELMAIASGDQTVGVVPVTRSGPPMMLQGHTASINDISWSPNKTRLATASDDKTVRIWDIATGREVLTFNENRPVSCVAWSPDGMLLASCDSDQTIRIRNATTGYIAGAAPSYLPLLDRRLETTPAAPALWRIRAEIHAAQGDWDGAAGDLQKYLGLKKDEHWSMIGYWVAGSYPGDFTAHYAPESNPDPAKPVASSELAESSPKLINWQRVPYTPSGFINFALLLDKNKPLPVSAYALLKVYSPEERQVAALLSADDKVRVWLNEKQIYESQEYQGFNPNSNAVAVTLRPGWNTLLARVVNEVGDHTLYLRLSNQAEDLAKLKPDAPH